MATLMTGLLAGMVVATIFGSADSGGEGDKWHFYCSSPILGQLVTARLARVEVGTGLAKRTEAKIGMACSIPVCNILQFEADTETLAHVMLSTLHLSRQALQLHH